MTDQLDLFDVAASPVGVGAARAEDHLPPVAREILALVGHESLVRLVNKWGGVHLDFPRYPSSFGRSTVVEQLADEIGQADAHRIANHFLGVRLHVPKCAKALRVITERKIRDELDKGTPAHELARRFDTTERTIWRIAKRL